MTTVVPLSRFQRSTSEVTALVAESDVILGRREAEDLYLSTRARQERSADAARITTAMLADLAATRPDVAGEVMTRALPWMSWLPTSDKVDCLSELLDQLRAGAQTGQLAPFERALEAWRSTAVIYSDPDVLAEIQRERTSAEFDEGDVAFPGHSEVARQDATR